MSAGASAAAVLISFSTASPGEVQSEQGEVRVAPTPVQLADFELIDQNGHPFRFSERKGANALVFFGFAHCPDIWSRHAVQAEVAHRYAPTGWRLGACRHHGDRDTSAALKAYLAPLSKDFIGLTGDPRTVRAIAANFSAVFFKGLPADNSGNYLVEHTSQVYLVDAQGRLHATFFDASVERMSQTVRSLDAHRGS
jgi:protein SCO1/2